MRNWSEVEQSREYLLLPEGDKLKARIQYFNDTIQQKPEYQSLPDIDKERAKSQFLKTEVTQPIERPPVTLPPGLKAPTPEVPAPVGLAEEVTTPTPLIQPKVAPKIPLEERGIKFLEKFSGTSLEPIRKLYEMPEITPEGIKEGMKAVGKAGLTAIQVGFEPFTRLFENIPANILTGIQEGKHIPELIRLGTAPLRKIELKSEERRYLADVFRNYNSALGVITGVKTTPVDEISAIAGGIGLRLLMPDIYSQTARATKELVKKAGEYPADLEAFKRNLTDALIKQAGVPTAVGEPPPMLKPPIAGLPAIKPQLPAMVEWATKNATNIPLVGTPEAQAKRIELFGKTLQPFIKAVKEVQPEVTPAVAKEPWQLTRRDYLTKLNPEGKKLTSVERPTVYSADLEGMADGAKVIKKVGDITIKSDGTSLYAVKGEKTVGYISPLSDKEIDLTVAADYQKQGIGTKLLSEFRQKNPFFESGGYTVSGLKTEMKVHKQSIQQALAQGKPVPPEVLAEYPDLAPAVEVLDKRIPGKLYKGQTIKSAMEMAAKSPDVHFRVESVFEKDRLAGEPVGKKFILYADDTRITTELPKEAYDYYVSLKGIPAVEKAIPEGLKRPREIKKVKTLHAAIRAEGGIDLKGLAEDRGMSLKELEEDIPGIRLLGGKIGADIQARNLASTGHIEILEGEDEVQVMLDGLRNKAFSNLYDRSDEIEKEINEGLKNILQEAKDGGLTPADLREITERVQKTRAGEHPAEESRIIEEAVAEPEEVKLKRREVYDYQGKQVVYTGQTTFDNKVVVQDVKTGGIINVLPDELTEWGEAEQVRMEVPSEKAKIPEPLARITPPTTAEQIDTERARIETERKVVVQPELGLEGKLLPGLAPTGRPKSVIIQGKKYPITYDSRGKPSLPLEAALTPEGKEILRGVPEGLKRKPEFIEEGPTVGLATKDVIPTSIRVEREPKDLVGLKGFLESVFIPVRHVTGDNPIAIRIAKMGREVMLNLSSEQTHYNERIDDAYRGLSSAQKEEVVDTLEGKPTTLNARQQKAHQVSNEIRTEMREMSEKDIGIDISKWGITPEEYFPHIFVGSYQIKDGTKTIEGGFARDLREAIDKAVAYIKANPKADINIAPKDFGDEYSATMLSRKGFWRFISEVKKSTALDKDEILSMMKGVAAIKPRGKFVGNFEQRIANLGGYIKNETALKIYTNRILRKKWLDPFRKEATELTTQLPPALKEYFDEYIGAVSGKYDPVNNQFRMSRVSGKITGLQSKLKLGYRPITALVNKLQPLQTAYAEIGNHLFRGQRFKKTPEGQKVLQDAKIAGQQPKYYTGEFLGKAREPIWKPLGLFSKGEMANREDVVSGGYLFASDVFKLSKEKATKQGYEYILAYLEQYKDPHIAAVEYAKDLNADTNYIYDVSDIPKALRHPIGRVAFQFKTFPINFTVQSYVWLKKVITEPTPHNIARGIRFISANLLLGGVRTIPYWGRWLWKVLMLGIGASFVHPKIKKVLGRGVFSLIGVDLSQRLGPNDFLPRNFRDALGPSAGDLYSLLQYARGDITLGELVTKPTGALRDLYRAMRETEYVADPNKRWRKIVETTGWDKFLQAIGSPSVKVETTRDMQVIFSALEREYKKKKAQYVDGIIARQKAGKEFRDLIKQADDEGIPITRKDVEAEKEKKEMTAMERRLETTPKALREKLREMTKEAF